MGAAAGSRWPDGAWPAWTCARALPRSCAARACRRGEPAARARLPASAWSGCGCPAISRRCCPLARRGPSKPEPSSWSACPTASGGIASATRRRTRARSGCTSPAPPDAEATAVTLRAGDRQAGHAHRLRHDQRTRAGIALWPEPASPAPRVRVETVTPAGARTHLATLTPRAEWERRYWLKQPLELAGRHAAGSQGHLAGRRRRARAGTRRCSAWTRSPRANPATRTPCAAVRPAPGRSPPAASASPPRSPV